MASSSTRAPTTGNAIPYSELGPADRAIRCFAVIEEALAHRDPEIAEMVLVAARSYVGQVRGARRRSSLSEACDDMEKRIAAADRSVPAAVRSAFYWLTIADREIVDGNLKGARFALRGAWTYAREVESDDERFPIAEHMIRLLVWLAERENADGSFW